jgi:ubiquitin C-terminal hydrolase
VAKVCQNSRDALHLTLSHIEPLVSVEIPFYSYCPAANARLLGFCGLANTSHVNAVLQQLFFTLPFRRQVLDPGFPNPQLRSLFASMARSSRRSADTAQFVRSWSGWGQPVNVREQQDSFDFLQAFLDGLPEACRQMFTGTSVNMFEVSSENYATEREEPFYGVPLEIKGIRNVDESIESYVQSELMTGREGYKLEDGRVVDARRCTRIKTAPEFLILHLKRFAYNVASGRRIKVNEHYEFPMALNITKLLREPADDRYRLKGVVLHAGNAMAGHYTSLVKISGRWLRFDDEFVEEVPEKEFGTLTFGGHPVGYDFDTSPGCAYMLFYERENLAEGNEIECELFAEIDEDNRVHAQIQSLFSPQMFHFVTQLTDVPIRLSYFVNVFCHSALADLATVMRTNLEDVFPDGVSVALEFFLANVDRVGAVLVNCSRSEIHSILTDILARTIVSSENGFALLDKLFELLPIALAAGVHRPAVVARCISRPR